MDKNEIEKISHNRILPPQGGIFLNKLDSMPIFIETAIRDIDIIFQQSSYAKLELDDEFEKLYLENVASYLNFNELDLTPDAVYARLLSKASELEWGDSEQATHIKMIVKRIETLKNIVNTYENSRSAICSFGEKLIETIKPHLIKGIQKIGANQYEVLERKSGGIIQEWLCGFDSNTSKIVYYNKWDAVENESSRLANLNDYVQIIEDIYS